jgi:hypothetical protein
VLLLSWAPSFVPEHWADIEGTSITVLMPQGLGTKCWTAQDGACVTALACHCVSFTPGWL